MKTFFCVLLSSCLLSACASTTYQTKEKVAFELIGNIAWVGDGDTLGLEVAANEVVTIRLSDIDAPETYHASRVSPLSCATPKLSDRPGQPFAQEAKGRLRRIAPKGALAQAYCFDTDKYQRKVCHVKVKGLFLHQRMLSAGFAMTTSNPAWIRDLESTALEREAKKQKLGLWAQEKPIHPDDWRDDCWCKGNCPGGVTTLSTPR